LSGEPFDRHPGRDRHHERISPQVSAHFVQRLPHHLRLHGQKHDVARRELGAVRGDDYRPRHLALKGLARRRNWVACHQRRRGDELCRDEPAR
jgi:hypothetical protein